MSLLEQIEDILETKIHHRKDETKLVELGADSMKLVQVGALVEDTVGTELTQEDMFKMTVGSLRRLLSPRTGSSTAGAASC